MLVILCTSLLVCYVGDSSGDNFYLYVMWVTVLVLLCIYMLCRLQCWRYFVCVCYVDDSVGDGDSAGDTLYLYLMWVTVLVILCICMLCR